MNCPVCNSKNTVKDIVEVYTCSLCSSKVNMVSSICNDCKTKWSSINGEVVEYREAVVLEDECNDFPQTFSDYIHKCIKCGENAYEFRPCKFVCSHCNFEWEVL